MMPSSVPLFFSHNCLPLSLAPLLFLYGSVDCRHLAAVDGARFAEVWHMKEAEVWELAERVLDIDRLLHEQQLGLVWERPTMLPELYPFSSRGPWRSTSE